MDEQRKRVYSYRQKVLDGVNCRDLVAEMIGQQVDENIKQFLDPTYGSDSFAAAAGNLLHVQLEGRDYRSVMFADADRTAHDEANRMAESQVFDAIEENLPDDEEQAEWNWTRWRIGQTRVGASICEIAI